MLLMKTSTAGSFQYELFRIKYQPVHKVTNSAFISSSSNCTDGYLKIYLKGQETMDAYDKYDHELCGTERPLPVVSDGPRLVMVFSSGELQGRGFKVRSKIS